MSKVLVTETHLEDIADAIRDKLGVTTTYRPGDMAAAIESIDTAGEMEPLTARANGEYAPTAPIEGFDSVTVEVPTFTASIVQDAVLLSGEQVSVASDAVDINTANKFIHKNITENGTYDPDDDNAQAYSSVTVDVQDWPFVNEITEGGTGFVVNVSGSEPLDVSSLPANVKTFYNDYARTPKPTTEDYDINITEDDAGLTLAELKAAHTPQLTMEYYGNVYGDTSMIAALGLVLLGDFSQGGAATGNALSGSINAYSAVILQGIYRGARQSEYNTSMLYVAPALGNAYWAGMKDRNSSYDCNVTFTDDRTVSLSGNRQVIIYGMP